MNAIDSRVWNSISHRLGKCSHSNTKARLANGTTIPSQGQWIRYIALGDISPVGGFEIINSGGAFEILLGKPWLRTAGVVQNFTKDTLVAKRIDGSEVEVRNRGTMIVEEELGREEVAETGDEEGDPTKTNIMTIMEDCGNVGRKTDRFKQKRVQEIIDKVTIGQDLTEEQCMGVITLIQEFADVFALTLSEVQPVKFIRHALNLPPGTKGPSQASQKPLTEPQHEWLY